MWTASKKVSNELSPEHECRSWAIRGREDSDNSPSRRQDTGFAELGYRQYVGVSELATVFFYVREPPLPSAHKQRSQ